MSIEVLVTVIALALELGLLAFFVVQSRKRPDPNNIRMFPYTAAIVVMTLVILLTVAHLVSLLTGTQLTAKRPKGMR
jgi:hypothetical protein